MLVRKFQGGVIMGLRINYNGAAANAWRNLGISDSRLASSVEKLSSGLRINKAGDDPAGLIISERLKAQITGLGQAVRNAQEAVSLVQTAEGALTEMNNMLNKIRALAVHSANEGVNDTDTIAADQSQVDSALDSLQKIAENTKYQQKLLLDGSSANTANIVDTFSTSVSSISVKGSITGNTTGLTGSAELVITNNAERAYAIGSTFTTDHAGGTITINSSDFDAVDVTLASNADIDSVASSINQFYDQTGVWASSASASQLAFTFSAYGDSHDITISTSLTNVLASAADAITDTGVDITGQLNVTYDGAATVLSLTGDGLQFTVDTGEEALVGTELNIAGADATDTNQRAGIGSLGGNVAATMTDAFSVTEGALSFSLGQDANSNEIRTLSIANMQINEMGRVTGIANSTLNAIRTGGTYSLANDAANAVLIIDQAIDDVSIARSDLGAFQQNALETTIANLSINKENLEASNSRIRDVDMAMEMMAFTKNQILTQAGTAMLAQANQLPSTVLQLLG